MLNTTIDPGEISAEQIAEAAILSLIAFVAFFGNVSLWLIICTEKCLRSPSNVLILSLSAADLMVSAVNMPVIVYTIIIARWPFSQSACTGLGFSTMLTFVASVMNLGTISINRYIHICHPAKFKTLYSYRNAFLFVLGTWCLSICLASPPLMGWCRYDYIPSQRYCFAYWKDSVSYTYFMVGMCFGGPCSVMTYCYANILREHRQSMQRVDIDPNGSLTAGRKRLSLTRKSKHPKVTPETIVSEWRRQRALRRRQEELRLTTSLFVVICCFVVCWLPFCIAMFLWVHGQTAPKSFDLATLLLGCFNSAINPFIYGVMNRKFRQGYIKLFFCFRKNLTINSNSAEDSVENKNLSNPATPNNNSPQKDKMAEVHV
uniref:FVRIamide receptor 1 n=1 Tax=Platynereis dumerilii TaxID=6359 RepID=A0A0K0PUV0_PLADU|nr:FVRIamide receptor 1 [Platynereis dumerilii]